MPHLYRSRSSHTNCDIRTGEHKYSNAGQAIIGFLFFAAWLPDSSLEFSTFLNPYIPNSVRLPEGLGAWLRMPSFTRNAGRLLCLALIALIYFIGIRERLDIDYYHMIDETDHQDFVWIRDNVGGDYDKAILDPWKATAFTAIIGEHIYTRIRMRAEPSDKEAYYFIKSGSTDTEFLKENGISIVYTRVYDEIKEINRNFSSANPDLVEVAENIYLLKK